MYIEYVGWDRIRPIFWSLNICFSSISLKDEKSTRLLQKGDTAWFGFPRLDFLSSSIVQAGRQEDDSSREARWTTRAEKQRCRGEKARAQEQEWWPLASATSALNPITGPYRGRPTDRDRPPCHELRLWIFCAHWWWRTDATAASYPTHRHSRVTHSKHLQWTKEGPMDGWLSIVTSSRVRLFPLTSLSWHSLDPIGYWKSNTKYLIQIQMV
jgi:hypothetical protein